MYAHLMTLVMGGTGFLIWHVWLNGVIVDEMRRELADWQEVGGQEI